MERNPNFSKEKADFIFNRVQKYFDRHAYRLALSEIEENRELLGSSLNIGSQLKLNKIYSKAVVSLLLDDFEVEGDLSAFASLFARHKTMLELHTDRETYQLLHTYLVQKESNPSYKSREIPLNKIVEPDESVYPDDQVVQISIKNPGEKRPSARDIERDFLESIESPSFQYGQLSKAEEEILDDKVIRSHVDTKAIHDDFFEAIRAPKLSDFRDNVENYEQLSFESTGVSSKPHETDPDRPVKPSHREDAAIEPISIEQTILAKEDDSLQAIREKLQRIEERTSGKKPEPKPPSNVKEQREIVKSGTTRRETIHKSGGKITEITIEGYSSGTDKTKTPKESDLYVQPTKPQKKDLRRRDSSNQESVKKDSLRREISHREPSAASGDRPLFADNRKPVVTDRKSETKINFIVIALALLCAILLTFAAFQGVKRLLNQDSAPNSVVEPAEPTDTSNTEGQTSENTEPAQNGSTENTATENTESASSGTASTENTPAGTSDTSANQSDYLLPSDQRELVKADYENLTKAQVRIAINELFARHGWNFGGSGDMYDYFIQKSWYKPDLSMTSAANAEAKFSQIERKNLSVLTSYFQTLP